jgi:hypothetical protein
MSDRVDRLRIFEGYKPIVGFLGERFDEEQQEEEPI